MEMTGRVLLNDIAPALALGELRCRLRRPAKVPLLFVLAQAHFAARGRRPRRSLASLLITLVALAGFRGRLGLSPTVLRQRLTHVVAFLELPLVVTSDVALVRASIDQFPLGGLLANRSW